MSKQVEDLRKALSPAPAKEGDAEAPVVVPAAVADEARAARLNRVILVLVLLPLILFYVYSAFSR